MTLDMKKQDKWLHIRVNQVFLDQLKYLCNRSGYRISKSEIIRKLVNDEFIQCFLLDKRSE